MKLKALLLSVLALSACEPQEKSYAAFEREKEARENSEDVFIAFQDSMVAVVPYEKILNEWQKYEAETLQKIDLCNAHIKLLKNRKVKADYQEKFNKQISKLEEQNNKLKTKMDDYYNERERTWLEFKLDMEQQSNDINAEIDFLQQTKSSQGTYFEELFN